MTKIVNKPPPSILDEHSIELAVRRAAYRSLLGREPEPAAIDPATPPLLSEEFEHSLADILRTFVDSAEFAQQRLMFVVGALRQIFADENFVNLLRAEGLATLPKYLAERVWSSGSVT